MLVVISEVHHGRFAVAGRCQGVSPGVEHA
jgi:hypothetical protein